MLRTTGDARRFVEEIALPDLNPQFESVRATEIGGDALTVGGQLIEFSKSVLHDTRAAVSDSMLLAQLAADKAATPSDDVFAWYDKYVGVLRAIGWRVADAEQASHVDTLGHISVHKALIPVITGVLGPGAAAASIIVGVLGGLREMDADQPWITLFDMKSRHAHGAKFQVSFVDADDSGDPKITLLCFGVAARRTITQVLFFKFSNETAQVRQSIHHLSCNLASLPGDAIAARVQPFLAGNVAALVI